MCSFLMPIMPIACREKHILLLENPIPAALHSSSQKVRVAISWERKELAEMRWCLLQILKNKFLDFCILGISGYISGSKNTCWTPAGVKTTRLSRDFSNLDFW